MSDRASETWEVTVTVNGESILTIGSNHLSGVENISDYAGQVRYCGHALLAFIGPENPEPFDIGSESRNDG